MHGSCYVFTEQGPSSKGPWAFFVFARAMRALTELLRAIRREANPSGEHLFPAMGTVFPFFSFFVKENIMSALANPFSSSRPICALLGGLAAVCRDQKSKSAVCALLFSPRQLATIGGASSIDSVSADFHAEVPRHD